MSSIHNFDSVIARVVLSQNPKQALKNLGQDKKSVGGFENLGYIYIAKHEP